MTQSLRAVFEHGVLRPLEPLALRENQHVTVTLTDSENGDCSDTAFLRSIENDADESVSLDHVRACLAKIPGALREDIRRERDERG
jgi:predicted DNA-binding antitoxin AbrB/MazE fold protein